MYGTVRKIRGNGPYVPVRTERTSVCVGFWPELVNEASNWKTETTFYSSTFNFAYWGMFSGCFEHI